MWDTLAVPYTYSATYITYENPTTGAAVTSQNSRYVNSYILFTTAKDSARFIVVPGRAHFTSLALAQGEDPKLFNWTGFNLPEAVIMYRCSWFTGSGYGGALGRVKLASITTVSQSIASTSIPYPVESDPIYVADSGAIKDTLDAHNSRINLRALKATTISTTSPLTGGGDLSANRTFAIDTTKVVLFNDTLPLGKIATKKALSDGLAVKRNLNNHDSLSKLDEKSYESLTSKPVLTVVHDLPYSSVISLDSSDIILTAKEYNTLEQVGNEVIIGTDTTKLATKIYTDTKQAITDTTTKDATRYWVGQNYQPTVTAGYRIGKSGVTINNVDYWKNQDTLKTTLSGLVKATGGVLTTIPDASTNWNDAFAFGPHTGLYVPLARQLTINGTAYDLSANRTWDVGTLLPSDTASLLLSRLRAGHDYATKSHTQSINTVTGLQDSLTDSWNKRDTITALLSRARATSTYQPKDTLTVKQDLPNSSIISHNGRNVILTADSGLTLTQTGDELAFKSAVGVSAKQDLPNSVRITTGILNTPEIVLTANGYNELVLKGDEVSISSDTFKLATRYYAEPKLGNPTASGYVLASTDVGVRSWVSQAGGMSYPGAGIAKSNGSAWVTSLVDSSAYWKKAYDSVVSTSYLKKFTFDANGDLVVGTGNNTYSKLARGSTGQLLATKSDGFLEWVTPAEGTTYTAGLRIVIDGSVIGNTSYWGDQDSLKTTLSGIILSTAGKLTAITNSSSNWDAGYTHSTASHQTIINGTGFVKTSGTTLSYDNSTYLTSQTSHTDVVVDGDFTSNGLMKRTAAGTYGIVTDNSAAWDSLVTFPGFGTTHALAAYGDHAHSDYTPTSRTLTINGTTSDLTNNRSWTVGSVTSVATSPPLTGTITSSGTLGITQAGTSSDGYLSSADWGTFNAKLTDDVRWYTNETGASHFAIAPVTTLGGKTLKQVNLFTSLVISRWGGFSWGGGTPPYSLYVVGKSLFDSAAIFNNVGTTGQRQAVTAVASGVNSGSNIGVYSSALNGTYNYSFFGYHGRLYNGETVEFPKVGQSGAYDSIYVKETSSGLLKTAIKPTSDLWTTTGSDIYRNSKVSIGSTTAPDSALLLTGGQHNTGGLKVDKNIRVGDSITGPKFMITKEGGYAVKMTAGETLSRGEIVSIVSDGEVYAYMSDTPYDYVLPVGVVYSASTNGNPVWVVISGIADIIINGATDSGYDGYASIGAIIVPDTYNVHGRATSYSHDKFIIYCSDPINIPPRVGTWIEDKTTPGLAKGIINIQPAIQWDCP